MVGSVGRALRAAFVVVFFFAFPSGTVIAEPIFQDRFEPVQEEGPRAGTAFKGPFRIGSSVTLLTLRPDLSQAGDPFFGDIISHDGQYRIDADIPPGVVELVVTGNFFHETLNDNTIQPLTLFALTERTGALNINLLTAIERDRIRLLVRNGSSFADAKSQAINELFAIFGSAPVAQDTTEISLTSSDGPVLLALTAMLTTRPDGTARSVPDMQQLITQLRTDFETGQFTSPRLQELFRSAAAINTDVIRSNLSNYYASIGVSIEVPDFSQAILDFLTATGFEITASASDGGEISPTGSVWALPGTQTAFQLTPTDGFSVDTIDGSCEGTLSGNVFTTNPIGADCTIEATFAINVYTVTPAAGPNGSIDPSEPLTVEHGQVLEFQLVPDEGFSVAGVTGNCGGQINENIYTTAPITANCDFTIDFTVSIYPVTASVGSGNGTITPSFQQVQHGSDATFAITPQTGWSINSVTGDTCSPEEQGEGTWVAASVIAACTVTVDFSINTFTVTVTTQGDGSTSPSGSVIVEFESQLQIELEPAEGQSVSNIESTCGGTRNDSSFLTDPISADCSVTVSFFDSFFLAENGITVKCPFADIGESGAVNGKIYTRRTRDQITAQNASNTCTTGITNMSALFGSNSTFNAQIESWDTSEVVSMESMFEGTSFNQAIAIWDTSSVISMRRMFANTTAFNQPIGSWNTSAVQNMEGMFEGAQSFNQDIQDWDTSNVIDMRRMFVFAAAFNRPLSGWNTSSVTNMREMFEGAVFNQPIGDWDTSAVTTMSGMFGRTVAFNQPISTWDTSSVLTMDRMFDNAQAFNQPLENWDVSSVTNMSQMFRSATAFNQSLDSWDTSAVSNMSEMFQSAGAFNGSISQWNTASVSNMSRMFDGAFAFNQDIGSWATGNVSGMVQMFRGAGLFNQDLSGWCVSGFSQEPFQFSQGASSWVLPKPAWGTCPEP